MRTVLLINRGWFYKPSFSGQEDLGAPADSEGFSPVCLPHTNIQLPYNYFSDEAFRFISCYKRALDIDPAWREQRVFADFEGVMAAAQLWCNGQFVGEHKGGYTPFSVELTDVLSYDGNNELTVVVDSTERPDTPPFGGTIDYLTYGGIYREVQLRVVLRTYIEDVFVTTPDVLQPHKRLDAQITLSDEPEDAAYAVRITLRDGEQEIASREEPLPAGESVHQLSLEALQGIRLWGPDEPHLYHVDAALLREGAEIDRHTVRMGFREVRFEAEGFFLNGQKMKLIGLNRHQAFPYVGYAMPARAQRRDADILKYELGLNAVRTSHYPQSRHFLDRCDEIGLLVFEEVPGWQHVGDAAWQQQVAEDVRQMIMRDRSRPSIFLWGVRVNESLDHHDLYARTNALARQLDPTRPTGGARYLAHSEFLEDVYTMNDFIHDNGYGKYLARVIPNYQTYDHLQGQDGERLALRDPRMVTGLDRDVPYLVTEYNGHMYPTKRFDQEERAVEHALRHARVQNAAQADPRIAGAIGWCAFDYNTHADFGAGDKICYHGVMDMYRIPKMAAWAYLSQQAPQKGLVLEPATYWARGERSIGGVIPLVIFTNCEEVTFVYGGEEKGTYRPDFKSFPALDHPPIVIDQMPGGWGSRWEDGLFIGRIGGREVIRRHFSRDPVPGALTLTADDIRLDAGDWDATRLVISVRDQLGNRMPFFQEAVILRVDGAGELIGPSSLSLIGGETACWVRTTGEAGGITVTAVCPMLGQEAQVQLRVG